MSNDNNNPILELQPGDTVEVDGKLCLTYNGFARILAEVQGAAVPTCRICGCTDETACMGIHTIKGLVSCWWVLPDLCCRCMPSETLVVNGQTVDIREHLEAANGIQWIDNDTATTTNVAVSRCAHCGERVSGDPEAHVCPPQNKGERPDYRKKYLA